MKTKVPSCADSALAAASSAISDWWTDAPTRAWLQQHVKIYRAQLDNLSRQIGKGAKVERKARDVVLGSASGRVCCLVRAAFKRGRVLSRAEVEFQAGRLRPWKDCGEPIIAVIIKTSGGKERLTASLGVQRLALNYIVRDTLTASFGLAQDEFNRPGRGTHDLIEALMERIRAANDWVGTADIKDFYPSVGKEGLAERLKLPGTLVDHVILIGEEVPIRMPDGSKASESVRDLLRRGIPQGAPTSSFIASKILSDIVGQLETDATILRYADDLVVVGWSKSEVDATLNALKASFGSSPAGGLTLHKIDIRHIDEGVRVLGYKVITDPSADTYIPRAFPAGAAFERHFDRLASSLADISPQGRDDFAIEKTLQWISNWRCWSPSERRIEAVLDQALALSALVTRFDVPAHYEA